MVSLKQINLLLEGTPGFYDDVRLRHHISVNTVRELRLATSKANILRIADYKKWKESLAEIDSCRLEDHTMRVRDFEKMMNNRSRNNNTTTRAPSSASTSRVMHDYCQSNASVVVSTNSGSSSAARVPPLTPEKRKLLCDSNGCYKCQIPYADHSALTCTNSFPNVSTYKTLTLEDVNKAATCRSSKKINAITSPLAEFSDVTNTMNIGAIHSQSPIAMCSSVLSSGDNNFTDSECVSNFFAPHVYWPAVIHGPSIISEPIQTLIDCSSPTYWVSFPFLGQIKVG